MAWRFKPSKFKNTTPKQPKKEDTIYDVPIGTLSCTNNGIKSSASLLAFHIEGEGGKLGVLPIDARGRRLRQDLSVVCAHGDVINDFDFLPFNDRVLLTCSRDEKLKLWRFDDENANLASTLGEPFQAIDLGADRFLECIATHPTTEDLIAVGSGDGAIVVDLHKSQAAMEVGGVDDKVQSASWSGDGKLLALTSDKGRKGYLFDPRASCRAIASTDLHAGMGREGRIVFLGDTGKVLTSGFTSKRCQEIMLFDARNFAQPLHTEELGPSTGVVIPLYDADTRLIFLAGKGSNKLVIGELVDKDPIFSYVFQHPLTEQLLGGCLAPKSAVDVMSGEVQRFFQLSKSAIVPISCVVPRRTYRDFHSDLYPDTVGLVPGTTADEWMGGSNQLPPKYSLDPAHRSKFNLMATNGVARDISPSIDQAPPPTPKSDPPTHLMPSAELNGHASKAEEVTAAHPVDAYTPPIADDHSLFHTPQHRPIAPVFDDTPNSEYSTPSAVPFAPRQEPSAVPFAPRQEPSAVPFAPRQEPSAVPFAPRQEPSAVPFAPRQEHQEQEQPVVFERHSVRSKVDEISKTLKNEPPAEEPIAPPRPMSMVEPKTVTIRQSSATAPRARDRPKSCVVGQIQSKFRHVETLSGGKERMFFNLRKINTRLPIESNGFCVSAKWAAVPLMGPGGVIAIFDLSQPQKLPDGVIPGLENKTTVTDLIWSSFNPDELAVACDNGTVNVWHIPAGGVDTLDLEPSFTLKAGNEKIVSIRYHPLASDVLAVASNDLTVSVFDMKSQTVRVTLAGHQQPILSIAWSADGQKLATVARDAELRVFEPQQGDSALVAQANILESTRGARVLFVCDDRLILVVNFSRSSSRQISLYDAVSLAHLHTTIVDTSPSVLIPHYDYDSSVLTLTGKGDRMVHMYEVSPEAPFLMNLAPYMAPTGHQALSMQQKNECDVRAVEFQRGWRLTDKTVEFLLFKVPRVKKDLFQNDLFPDALVTWSPTLTGEQWFTGSKQQPRFQCLKPSDMQNLVSEDAASEVRAPQPTARKAPTLNKVYERNEDQERKEVTASWSKQIGVDASLEQDRMEGVAEEEWMDDA